MDNEKIDNHLQEEEEQLDELPQLYHTSSIRDPKDPPLPVVSKQTHEIDKSISAGQLESINGYVVREEIGRGAFGSVYLVECGDRRFAMKIYNLYGLQKQKFWAADGEFADSLDMLRNQLNIIKRIEHKNIARCHEILYDKDRIYLINELGDLGQMMLWKGQQRKYVRNQLVIKYIQEKYGTVDLGDVTRIIFLQICQAVKYLHQNQITNRDIKVDNIICKCSHLLGHEIKIIDFTTVRYRQDDISYFATGTPGFRGPEHDAATYGYSCKATDVFAVGYSMYVFYYQVLPFYAESEYQMSVRTETVQLEFDQKCPEVIRETIKAMTCKNWKQRITIQQALELLKK